MLTYTRNTLFGLVGLSLISLAAAPAQANGWKNNHHRHGPRVVKVVKKIVYVAPRETRRHRRADRRWHRRWDRRWDRRQTRRWNRRHNYTRVVYHHTTVAQPSYRRGNNAVTGSVIGAVLGGLTGSAIVRGRGKFPAILAGGVLGAIIGGSIGDSMDKTDRLHTHQAMETARTGQNVTWTNPDTGAEYSVTPTRTYQRESGQYCRDYKSWGWIDGYEEELNGTVCRARDGSWRKVS